MKRSATYRSAIAALGFLAGALSLDGVALSQEVLVAQTQPESEAQPSSSSEPSSTPADYVAELREKAAAGDTGAMVDLGIYHEGTPQASDPVPRSLDEAERWFEKAANAGNADAALSLAFLLELQRKDHEKALVWFQKAADLGKEPAMLALSRFYDHGRGVEKDETKSFEWAKKATESDDAAAAYELAEKYFHGRGTRQDFVEAAQWYRKAADKNFAPAMIKLSQIYASGMGLSQDLKAGFNWAQKAAEAGSPIAMYQLGTFYLEVRVSTGLPPKPGAGTRRRPIRVRRKPCSGSPTSTTTALEWRPTRAWRPIG